MPTNPGMKLENAIDVKVAEARMLPVDPAALVRDKLDMLQKFDALLK